MNFAAAPVTLILIALNVIISLIGFNNSSFLHRFLFWPFKTKRNNDYIRFISSGFLHLDFMHLFFNMFTLYFFGQLVEQIFAIAFPGGRLWYILLYFAGMIVADIPSYIKHQNNPNYTSLGASGAVAAVVFAAILFDPWSQLRLYGVIALSSMLFAVLYIVYCVYMGKRGGDNVNHDAHLWGSLFGLAFALVLVFALRPDILPYIGDDMKNPSFFGRQGLGETLKYILSGR